MGKVYKNMKQTYHITDQDVSFDFVDNSQNEEEVEILVSPAEKLERIRR